MPAFNSFIYFVNIFLENREFIKKKFSILPLTPYLFPFYILIFMQTLFSFCFVNHISSNKISLVVQLQCRNRSLVFRTPHQKRPPDNKYIFKTAWRAFTFHFSKTVSISYSATSQKLVCRSSQFLCIPPRLSNNSYYYTPSYITVKYHLRLKMGLEGSLYRRVNRNISRFE